MTESLEIIWTDEGIVLKNVFIIPIIFKYFFYVGYSRSQDDYIFSDSELLFVESGRMKVKEEFCIIIFP